MDDPREDEPIVEEPQSDTIEEPKPNESVDVVEEENAEEDELLSEADSAVAVEQATALKARGNELYAAHDYQTAIDTYTEALDTTEHARDADTVVSCACLSCQTRL